VKKQNINCQYFITYIIIQNTEVSGFLNFKGGGLKKMYCPKCGAENQENAEFCQKCGNQLNATANQPVQGSNGKPTSRLTMLLIGVIVLIIAIFGAFIIFGTDVFAEEAISEEGATNIVNSTINSTITNYPEEAKNFQIGKAKKVKQSGKTVWQVPVKYIGTIPAIAGVWNGNPVFIPAKGTLGANNQISAIVTLPNGSTITITTTKNGAGPIVITSGKTTIIIPRSVQPTTTTPTTTTQNQESGGWYDDTGQYHTEGSLEEYINEFD
jgi:hypothetical protein